MHRRILILILALLMIFPSIKPLPLPAQEGSPDNSKAVTDTGQAPSHQVGASTTPDYEALLKSIQPDARPVVDKITRRVAVDSKDWLYAAEFAPVFYQSIGEIRQWDYMLRFDYDGKWEGKSRWKNVGNKKKKDMDLAGYVYFATAETQTHFFIYYVVYHAQDYKGQGGKGAGAALGIGGEFLSHANDLEGALVVVKKNGDDPKDGAVVFVQTMAHFHFYTYYNPALRDYFTDTLLKARKLSPRDVILLEGKHPQLFIESRGHGIFKFKGKPERNMIVYRYKPKAESPEMYRKDEGNRYRERFLGQRKMGRIAVGYNLIPLYDTFWELACSEIKGDDPVFGKVQDYTFEPAERAPTFFQKQIQPNQPKLRVKIGVALRGGVISGRNKARFPWGWGELFSNKYDNGQWFFNPAPLLKTEYHLEEGFSLEYVHHPYINIFRRSGDGTLPAGADLPRDAAPVSAQDALRGKTL